MKLAERRRFGAPGLAFAGDRRRLRVGLVNNMPDAALAVTERQFRSLMEAAAPERTVELQLFHNPEISRGPEAATRLRARYRPAEEIENAGLHALIVTGAEPRAANLREEPFWPSLQRLVDWAGTTGVPTLWSCLAAHAAVLHLDGVARRPLAQKCSGLFAVTPADASAADPLLAGLDLSWVTPHSRSNGLDEDELIGCGYRILTHGPNFGVDAFARVHSRSRFLFLQGHPEYDANSLALEFKRDLHRYVDGLRPEPPAVPHDLFAAATLGRMEALVDAARNGRGDAATQGWPASSALGLTANTWRGPAARLVRNWLASSLVENTAERLGEAFEAVSFSA